MWTAWNEPNNPIWLSPQYKRVGKTWRVESAFQYAKICNAVYDGVHSPFLGPLPDEHVACGVTGPKGNDAPAHEARVGRPAHVPHAGAPVRHEDASTSTRTTRIADIGENESPTYVPKGKFKRRVQLGNINLLLKLMSQFYGPKHLWITEYGYQTNPPDKTFGVPYDEAGAVPDAVVCDRAQEPAHRHDALVPREDEPAVGSWQSGLTTATGKKKPAVERVPRAFRAARPWPSKNSTVRRRPSSRAISGA